jgi:hypothetical protein
MIHCLFPCQHQHRPSHSVTKYLLDNNIIINDEYIDIPTHNKLSFSYFSLNTAKTINISHHNLNLTQTIQGLRSFPSLKTPNNVSTTTSQQSLHNGIRSTKTTMSDRKNVTLLKIKKYLKDNSF